MYLGMFYDPTYILVLIGAGLCIWASARVKSTYSKYAKVKNRAGLTGRDAAERILQNAGLYDVQIQHVSGDLTDHYDPKNKTLNLSDTTYASQSVAAVGVAAHECGHAIQHSSGYAPLAFRSAFVPLANFGSMAAWPLIIIGLFIRGESSMTLINLGILAFSLSVIFQLITLPVEFNASSRAITILNDTGMLAVEEVDDTKRVLSAAALTYVASAAASILQLLRLVLIARGRDND